MGSLGESLPNSLKKPESLLGGVDGPPSDARRADDSPDPVWRYGSKERLEKELAARGPGAYVVGVRPIGGRFVDAPQGSWADRHNLEILHEHLFYLGADGKLHDAGFFAREGSSGSSGEGGGIQQNTGERDDVGAYRFGPVMEGGEITERTLEHKGFKAADYHLIMRNCQDYLDALRRSALVSSRAAEE